MAKRQIVSYKYTDDLTGEELSEDEVSTIEFSYGSIDYTIDLSAENASKLDDFLAPYVDAATKVRKSGGSPKAKVTKAEKEDLDAIRAWARENGHEVKNRGRIAQPIKDAYYAAN